MGGVNDTKHEMCWSKEIAIKNGVSFGLDWSKECTNLGIAATDQWFPRMEEQHLG